MGHFGPHGIGDRSRVFTAEPEGFEEALSGRCNIDPLFAQIVPNDRDDGRRVRGRLVLNDFEASHAGALIAAPTDEQPPIGCRSEQGRACRRELRFRVEVPGDPDSMAKDCRLNIVYRLYNRLRGPGESIRQSAREDGLAWRRSSRRPAGAPWHYPACEMRDNATRPWPVKNFRESETRDPSELCRRGEAPRHDHQRAS